MHPRVLPDLGVMWDGMAITFAKMVCYEIFFLMQNGPSMYS